jgi:hypothetical protein
MESRVKTLGAVFAVALGAGSRQARDLLKRTLRRRMGRASTAQI